MLYNYLKVAIRNLWKSKGFTAINIIGLAIGLATCLLILIYVMDELSYDRYNVNADRIYRLDCDLKFGGSAMDLAAAPPPAGPVLVKDYPEVENAVRFRPNGGRLVKKGNQNIQEDAFTYADSTLFEVFTLPMIAGDRLNALRQPRSVVITERMARKYFDKEDVVGRTLMINDSLPYTVTGVIRDLPTQSHFHYDFFLPMIELQQETGRDDAWANTDFNTYLLLRKGADPKQFEVKLRQVITKYFAPFLKQAVNMSMEDFYKAGDRMRFYLTPLTAIHLHSNKTSELEANGNVQYVYIFTAVAIFILLIACVNFMNLSTARSSVRAREVGIRKVLGSLRGHLILQFLLESVMLSFIAMVLALELAWLFLPLFNQLSGKQMVLGLFSRPWLAPSIAGLMLIVGILAGSYPAFFLSAFRPIAVLKGRLASGIRTGWLRNSLVIFQFATSIFLLVGTAVIYRQLNYIHNRELGFDRQQVLIVQDTWHLGDGIRAFKEDLLALPGVEGATMTGFLPTSDYRMNDAIFPAPDIDARKAVNMQTWLVDEQYIPVLGMKMVAGRNFSKGLATDSNAAILNEAAARMLPWHDPLGHNVYQLEDITKKKVDIYHVIGVVHDFNFNSLREVVTPMLLFLHENRGSIALRVQTGDIQRLVGQAGKLWRKMASSQPFSYSFMDDQFDKLYRSEQRTGGIALSFSLLAIFVACLGLFGLAAYAAEQRTKEIGIRKVLGAGASGIVNLLSRDFMRLVLIAALISMPLSWWAMNTWLQNFAYRVGVSWWIFAVAGAAAVLIALVTVSFQTIRAAVANPIESLRSE